MEYSPKKMIDKMNEKVIGEFMENNKNGQNDENEGNNTTDENGII